MFHAIVSLKTVFETASPSCRLLDASRLDSSASSMPTSLLIKLLSERQLTLASDNRMLVVVRLDLSEFDCFLDLFPSMLNQILFLGTKVSSSSLSDGGIRTTLADNAISARLCKEKM